MGLFDRWKGQADRPIHQELKQMYQVTIQELIKNPNELHQFLRFSGQLYKYDMDSLFAIYAQAPNAKFIADFDTWKQVGRTVTKGSKAIKILHQKETGYFYHENVFDVSQTTGKDVPFPDWLLSNTEFNDTMKKVSSMSNDQQLSEEHNPRRVLYESVRLAINNHFDTMDSMTAADLAAISEYMLLSKLGQAPSFEIIEGNVQRLFRDEMRLIESFPKLLSVNRTTLTHIKQARKELLHEKEQANERIREAERLRRTAGQERGLSPQNQTTSEIDLHGSSGWSAVSDNNRTSQQPRTHNTGTVDSDLSDGTTAESLSRTDVNRRADGVSSEESGRIQGNALQSLSGTAETTTNQSEATDTSEAIEPTETTSRGVDESHALSDKVVDSSTDITLEEIYQTLKIHGFQFENGKFRIVEFFNKETNNLKRRSFIKKEFGTGGAHGQFKNRLSIDYSPRNVIFSDGKINGYSRKVTKTWTEVTGYIRYLIETDQYLSTEEKSAYKEYLANKKVEPTQEESTKTEKTSVQADEFSLGEADKPVNEALEVSLAESSDWSVLPDGYRYQELNNKFYLINEANEFEKDAYRIQVENGITYYQPYQAVEKTKKHPEKKTTEALDLFSFSYDSSEPSLSQTEPKLEPSGLPWINMTTNLKDYTWENEYGTGYLIHIVTKERIDAPFNFRYETDGFYIQPKTEESKDTIDNLVELANQSETKTIEFSFGEGATADFYEKTPKAKLHDNLVALRLLKRLDEEQRYATKEEQEVLAKYVGWGGLSDVFDDSKTSYTAERKELRALLSAEEYASARESVLTSYYTDPQIIQEMYKVLNNLGFSSGRVLDPSMGTGNFFAAMPTDMREQSELYGVELDALSARLAKQLHQQTAIQAKGFENVPFSEDSFDVVISNVPFADIQLQDNKTLDRYYVHDYFITHSLDLVREGGIVAVITSSGTLDKKDSRFRQELANKADLLGAVRLPNTAFKQIAGTEAVSDILFFQKKPKLQEYEQTLIPKNIDWVDTIEVASGQQLADGTPQPPMIINQYFEKVQYKNILGKFKFKNFHGGTYTVVSNEETPLPTLLSERLARIEGFYYPTEHLNQPLPDVSNELTVDMTIPAFSFYEQNGDIYYYTGQKLEKQDLKPTAKKRMQGMIHLRDQVVELITYQQDADFTEDDYLKKAAALNQTYDRFVNSYGFINTATNSRLFYEDDQSALLASIELPQKDGSYRKAEIFERPTIHPIVPITKVDTALEALHHSLAKKGKIDFDYMLSLYDVPENQLIKELDGHIYPDCKRYLQNGKNLRETFVTKEEYLSGDVKEKLEVAKLLQFDSPLFEANVLALENVIPPDLGIEDISYSLGSSWLPLDIYDQFLEEKLNIAPYMLSSEIIKIEYNRYTDNYHIEGKSRLSTNHIATTREYGTPRANALKILEKSLNFKTIQVYDQVEEWGMGEKVKQSVLNVEETTLARAKQDHLKNTFKSWLFSEPARAEKLLTLYNERFNRIRPRTYDGSYLSFEGMNDAFELRSHQKNVVARIVENGRAVMAHEVGAGKTASMISAGMMMKDQGLIQKPIYVVPNHLTEQFGQELLRFYPAKKVLITSKKDFEKRNRQKFISRIATGNYDAVIIGHSQFEKISLSKERQVSILKKELNEVKEAIRLEKKDQGKNWSVKQMVSFERRLSEKLKSLQNEDYKDKGLTFEELGVDFLFVDEAHTYKNLYTYTKMSNVAGVNTSNSLRATDMFMKCQYLLEKHNGRGVVFATGTPISNSMSELYTLQRFLQPDELAKMNLYSFDRWASTFGQVVQAAEINPEGSGFRMKNRFAKFHNLPELMDSFHLVADIQTSEMLNLPVPEIQNGKPQLIVSEASSYQKEKMVELAERSDAVRLRQVEPYEDNMLKITHEAKLMAIDPRLLDDTAPAYEEGKLFKCAENVANIWRETSEQHATQLIFSDSGTPKTNQFNVYDEMKRLLIENGLPEKEIAFIHSAKTDKQREELFEKVRHGDVRVLLGSTEKLGTGTNIQNKLLAVHHLDVPWRPSDLTQRDGRIVRQGNENQEVQIYRYVARNSFDGYLWQTQENKLKFINQIMTGNSVARSAEDIDQSTLDAAEAKALATNNPMLLEKLNVDKKVMNLQLLKSSWQSTRISLNQQVESTFPERLDVLSEGIPKLETDLATAQAQLPKEFEITLDGHVYTDRTEALSALNALLPEKNQGLGEAEIGEYKGFTLSVVPATSGQIVALLKGRAKHKTMIERNGAGSFVRMNNVLGTIATELNDVRNEQADLTTSLKEAKTQLEKPFEQDEQLTALMKKQSEINLALELGEPANNQNKQQEKVEAPEMDFPELDAQPASQSVSNEQRL